MNSKRKKPKLERSLVELGSIPSQPAPPGDLLHVLTDPTEPCFVLRAGDLMAPDFVRQWAAQAEQFGVEQDKVKAAKRCARKMDEWRIKKGLNR